MKLPGRVYAGMVILAVALALLFGALPVGQNLEYALYDARLAASRPPEPFPGILLVGIDDRSLEQVGPWPWPRRVHARLLRNLAEAGARVVFFDVLFEEAHRDDPEGDRRFAAALEDTGIGVLAGVARQGRLPGIHEPPRLMGALRRVVEGGRARIGLINIRPDPDGRIRRAVLGVEAGRPARVWPSAPLVLFSRVRRKGSPEGIAFGPQGVRVGEMRVPTTGADSPDPYELPILFRPPVTGQGAFRSPVRGTFSLVSYHELLDPASPILERVRGAVVLVGENTSKDRDLFPTPRGPMKGIEIHANILNTLLEGRFLHRAGGWADFLVTLAACGLLGGMLVRCRGVAGALGCWVGVAAGYAVLNYALFGRGVWLGAAVPLVGTALTGLLFPVARFLATTALFSRFVAPELVAELIASDQAARPDGKEVEATVVVTDVRGYTALSEGMPPEELMRLLNEYHHLTVEVFTRHGGRVMGYQGDAQIILFGGLKELAEPVVAAVASALEMQEKVGELRRRRGLRAEEAFQVGAGICTGPVTLGIAGGEDHWQHVVVGETARRAHKVQGQSAVLQSPVLLDEASFRQAQGRLLVEPLGPVEVPGVEGPLRLYRALGVRSRRSR